MLLGLFALPFPSRRYKAIKKRRIMLPLLPPAPKVMEGYVFARVGM